ncbi:MAG: hypothetical protein KDK45_09585, partial [Leptospiraceae bacterium]|nr:hypothetical protein [Leptospiraceae bacterium]
KSAVEYIKLFYSSYYDVKQESRETHNSFLESLDVKTTLQDPNIISRKIAEKKIPILAIQEGDDPYPIIQKLAEFLQTAKLLFFYKEQGFKTLNGNSYISIINLHKDYNRLKDDLDSEKADILGKINALFNNLPQRALSSAITSPVNLFKELFTVKGCGTYIKRGSEIQVYEGFESLDKDKIINLLETAFKKKVNQDFLSEPDMVILLEQEYRGAAIIRKSEYGFYLTKFAVDEIARGEGIGRELWDIMLDRFPIIFWRANPRNTINKWYAKECSGMHKFADWHVFWINLDPNLIPGVCDYVRRSKVDFYEK